ncbi:MAG TPA: signal peptidase II [Actinomycetota bacterium]|nr:signal peptidase II [Actinomycetota bacterium]
MTPKQRLYSRLLLVAALVVAVDQLTKQLALDRLSDGPWHLAECCVTFRLAFNSGGAFGFFPQAPTFFLVASLTVMLLILVWAGRATEDGSDMALGLVLGGGLGNVIDRAFRGLDGQVVDFIDLHVWPLFNVADSAIVIGVILIAGAGLFGKSAASDQ